MRPVLLDLTPLRTPAAQRGIGRYVRGLVQGLAELGPSAAPVVRGLVADPRFNELEVVDDLAGYCAQPADRFVASAGLRRSALLTFDLPRLLSSRRAAAHLSEPKGIPWSRAQPYSVTCHDLIPLVMHEQYLPRLPHYERLFAALERLRYRRPAAILAVSHATRRDLCERLGIDERAIEVVWHGVDHHRFTPQAEAADCALVESLLGSNGGFVLYLGAGDPRKDLSTLVSAYAASRLCGQLPLVLAGYLYPWRVRELTLLCQRLGIVREVKLLGYVPESAVPALYRAASVHVFPSRYEGFGLPVLEALACGAPTITSPGSSLDEVAGNAAEIVPCGDVEAMTAALELLAGNSEHRQLLRERGLARAATFTWRETALRTLKFWERLS
ncbi:MAG: glycosyltransferase family 1 protein [Polyangiaceae bacterium]